MAWVATNKDESEWVFLDKPIRKAMWSNFYEYGEQGVQLPKGSVAKLIGRELTWNDEPVELVEDILQEQGKCEGCESNSITKVGNADCKYCVDYCNYFPDKE